MNKNEDNLLDQDIQDRLNQEHADKPKITKTHNRSRYIQITVAVLLAALVLFGIIFPLFNMY